MPQLSEDTVADRAGADATVLERLRAGDEQAFREIVDSWSPAMLRLARSFVASTASAEDVVQDAWLGVVNGLGRFEGRSSLRSWVFTIVANRARTRGRREARTMIWSQLGADDDDAPVVDQARFQGPDGEYPGHWTSAGAPQRWDEFPERHALTREAVALVERELERLPPRQRLVAALRDLHGLTSAETCEILQISAENQRVLLHRARSSLRRALEDYYRG